MARKGIELSVSDYEEPHLNVPTQVIDTTGNYCPSTKKLKEMIFPMFVM